MALPSRGKSMIKCVTSSISAFEDKGEIALKNIARPVHVFSIAGSKPAAAPAPALALPDKPSIAVLPFQNMSGDAEQEYFTDGITEDITAALSRIPSLFVIARNSSFAYKGKAIDVCQIGRELGVRYLLEGSVRKAGSRLRITGQLIEAETRAHLWADKFDSVLEDVFDLQDRVTMAVAGAIEPSVTQAEIKRANRKPTESLQAYDWLLRARGEQQLFSRDGFDRAMAMGRRAIELDPRYAQAYGSLANWTTFRKFLGWMEDEEAETAEGVRFAQLAVQLAPNDSIVLTEAGVAVGNLIRDLASAIPWLDRAITLNPNSAHAYGRGAHVRNFVGDYAAAIGHADRAMRLSPLDPYSFTIQPGTRNQPFASTPAARCDHMAAQGSAPEPAVQPDIPDPRQCAGARRTVGGSPDGDPTAAGTTPDQQCEMAAGASAPPRGRLGLRAGGRTTGRPSRMSEQRRLAAILVADVVGYSKLVGSDEAGTLAQLQALRTDLIEPAIAKHAGRLFKAVGDGFLVEFASAVQAVEAARAIQQANADGELPLRIGIHVGDVVVQGDDLMGDGVNIAARIEARRRCRWHCLVTAGTRSGA